MKKSIYCISLIVIFILFSLVGCSKKSPEKNVIKIGVLLPLTGMMAKYGETIQSAAKLAVEELNNKEEINYIFELIFEDTKIDPKAGVSAMKKLIDIDNVAVILGPFASSVTLAVAPIAEENQTVLLTPGSSTPKITYAGDFIFRNCLSDTYEGNEMAKFAFRELNLQKIGIIYINNDFGEGLREVFTKTFEELGGEIIVTERYEQGSTDFRTQLSKVSAISPQGIYLIGYEDMVFIFWQARELGIKLQWLATTMLNDQSMIDKIGPGPADGAIFAAWEYDPESNNPRIREFVSKYRNYTGGIEPDVFAANTYDALYLIYEAVRKKDSSSISIKEGLYEIKDFNGVTGDTSFDSYGDVLKPISFRTILNGKIVFYVKEDDKELNEKN